MIKKIIVGVVLLISTLSFGQEGTASPYSFYGIGDVKFKGAIDNRSMGGVSVFSDSIHVNLQNPASFSKLRLTTFTVAGNYNSVGLKTSSESERAQRTTLEYLVVAMPISKKFGASIGLLPFSSVGYKIQNLNSEPGQVNNLYDGSGGVNRVFAALGYSITPHLSIGADLNYNFGDIATKNSTYITGVELGTREINESNISGVNVNFGLMYSRKVSEKHTLFSSFVYAPEGKLNLQNQRTIATVLFSPVFGEIPQVEEEIPVSNTRLKIPSKFGFGLGFGEEKKWGIGAEVTFQESSQFGNRFNDIQNASFENSQKISVGGFYIPNYSSFTSYFKRVTYRGGFNYENTGLLLNNEQINNYGITFGLGLPVTGSFSNINLGVEFGKRGTTNAGLIEENYLNVSIGLSLNDKWFVKRKYE
jgi:hypothetical protein